VSSLLVFTTLFILGIFQDALSAFYLRLVSERRIVLASVISVVITLVSCLVLAGLIESLIAGGFHNIAAYAVGGGIGTYLGLYKKA